MSVRYVSDRTGQDIPTEDHKHMWISIVLDSSYVSEPIKFKKAWDITTAAETQLRSDAITMKNAIEAAALAFINAVENP